ncbi:S9 family peptidase [Methanoplanus endosymbiosus]|uniref:S9 family peptidase n=1 Tax=Methanoplanus endosymbiosus TaxID=33865 RepID=A0A9E7TKU8_9EURY|nr:S9 family peptidase [Methanoplanus endosymbiosus]UUX93015.1 S9 family peptidase [Methanoplanus endosymbiosus]
MPKPPTEEQIKREEEKNDRTVAGENPPMISLWTIPAEHGAEPVKIAGGDCSVMDFSWAPDGSSIAFSHQKTAEFKDFGTQDISVVRLSDGSIRPLTTAIASKTNPVFSPDGKYVAFTACTVGKSIFFNNSAYITELNGENTIRLAPTYDNNPILFGWSADQSFLWFMECQDEQVIIGMLPVDGSEPEYFGPPDGVLWSSQLDHNAQMIGFSWENATSPDEGYITTADSFSPVQVTEVNDDIRSLPVAETEIISWESSDGLNIEGVLTYPFNYINGQKCPLIVFVHGGPAGTSYDNYYTNELPIPVASSEGYAVLRSNIRGSSGRGIDFREANVEDWGGMDYEDMMSGVDYLVEEGIADPNRLGIMGHSYGGYMTDWTVTQTDRFKAAVSYAGLSDLISFTLTTDAEQLIPDYLNTNVWGDYECIKSHSAIGSVKNVTTPVLFIHGEADTRIPPSQAQEMYTALALQGVPTRMVTYPREGHVISEPKHRMDYWQESLDWFDKYL